MTETQGMPTGAAEEIFDVSPDFVTLWSVAGWIGAPLGLLILLALLVYARAGSPQRSMMSSISRRSMR